jgi:hypothetical protein
MKEAAGDWRNSSIAAGNLSASQLLLGDVGGAAVSAARAVEHADRSEDDFWKIVSRAYNGDVLHAAGQRDEAHALFTDAERRTRELQPDYPLLYSLRGYQYCDLLLDCGEWMAVLERAARNLEVARRNRQLLSIALDELSLGRAALGLTLSGRGAADDTGARRAADAARDHLDRAAAGLRATESNNHLPRCLLARAALHRALCDWDGAARDLDEVEEIARPGPMRLYLCDLALERARLALAGCEAFAPLDGLDDDSPPKPEPRSPAERDRLHAEAAEQLRIAAEYIETCGYHRRDEELAETAGGFARRAQFRQPPAPRLTPPLSPCAGLTRASTSYLAGAEDMDPRVTPDNGPQGRPSGGAGGTNWVAQERKFL